MKKTFAFLLVLVMLLGAVPAVSLGSFADSDFTITAYNPGTHNGFENWKGPNGLQTQLLICTESFPEALDYSIPWEITFDDMHTIVRCPDSGSGNWLYRFEICTGPNYFIPKEGWDYTVSVRVEIDGVVYTAESDGFVLGTDPIIPLENATDFSPPYYMSIDPLFTHFENWENSPNKGSESAVTQLLVGITGGQIREIIDIPADLDWRITFYESDFGYITDEVKTIRCQPATKALQYNGLYRFEICLGDEENRFVPEYGKSYIIGIEVYDEFGTKLCYGESAREFTCNIDPIVPEDNGTNGGGNTQPPDFNGLLYLTPLFTHFENWENSPNKGDEQAVTQLLVGITDEYGNAVDIPENLDWELTIYGDDGSEYFGIIPPATKALVYDGLYRFEVCLADDPFIPKYGVEYSVAIDVCDGNVHYYHSGMTDGFLCGIEPIVPGVHVGGDEPDLQIHPTFSYFENCEIDGEQVTRLALHILNGDKIFTSPKDCIWYLRIMDEGADIYYLALDPVDCVNGTYYFEPVGETDLGEDGGWFIPEKGGMYSIGVEIYDEEFNPLYISSNSDRIVCDVEPVLPDWGFDDMIDLTLEAVKPVWQWTVKNGKNVLMLTFKITDAEGNAVDINGEWELAIAPEDAEDGAMLALTPVSVKNGIYVFEIPLDEFTPEKGVDYLLMAYFMDLESGEVHMSMPTEGFLYDLDLPDEGADGGESNGSEVGGDASDEDEKENEGNEQDNEKEDRVSVVIIVLISVGATLATVGVAVGIFIAIKKKRS